ncbi:MAG TPA: DUF3291 domain-containing protein, partial [Bryobacteraceae bacterium]
SYIQLYDDPRILINMSVWESMEALREYVYRGGHGAAFRDRRQWFEPLPPPSLALWWIAAGSVPTAAEGRRRLETLTRLGPTAAAFTMKQPFPPQSLCGAVNPGHSPTARLSGSVQAEADRAASPDRSR